jgi:Cu-Zn family superoxide dismutase
MSRLKLTLAFGGWLLLAASNLLAQSVVVKMYITNESATYVGTVTASDSQYGLLLTPDLHGLVPQVTPGVHGFHVHVNPSCANLGMAAGSHLDPKHANKHAGPYGTGHLGDLPIIVIESDGSATLPVLAPRLTVKDILGHSLMIHHGEDNYSDTPPLGGGGSRMVCGVIPKTADTN